MSELAATAERLRAVKNACLDFITFWAIDRMMEEDQLTDPIHGDLICASEDSQRSSFLQSDRYLDD